MKFISIPIFIVSLAVGLFFVYITNPEPEIIYIYPTPENVNKIQYQDKADNIWVSTTEGIHKFNKANNHFKQIKIL